MFFLLNGHHFFFKVQQSNHPYNIEGHVCHGNMDLCPFDSEISASSQSMVSNHGGKSPFYLIPFIICDVKFFSCCSCLIP